MGGFDPTMPCLTAYCASHAIHQCRLKIILLFMPEQMGLEGFFHQFDAAADGHFHPFRKIGFELQAAGGTFPALARQWRTGGTGFDQAGFHQVSKQKTGDQTVDQGRYRPSLLQRNAPRAAPLGGVG